MFIFIFVILPWSCLIVGLSFVNWLVVGSSSSSTKFRAASVFVVVDCPEFILVMIHKRISQPFHFSEERFWTDRTEITSHLHARWLHGMKTGYCRWPCRTVFEVSVWMLVGNCHCFVSEKNIPKVVPCRWYQFWMFVEDTSVSQQVLVVFIAGGT